MKTSNLRAGPSTPPAKALRLGLAEAVDCGHRAPDRLYFPKRVFRPEDVLSSTVAIDSMVSGVHASDHFGVSADIDLGHVCETSPQAPPTVVRPAKFTKEFLPDPHVRHGHRLRLRPEDVSPQSAPPLGVLRSDPLQQLQGRALVPLRLFLAGLRNAAGQDLSARASI